MDKQHCPICNNELIHKLVTPCVECGGDDMELDHYKTHRYREYDVYFDQRLILCDFCEVDFSSYDPTYFGFPKGTKIGLTHFNFVREIQNTELVLDKFCPDCNHRIGFIDFIVKCRKMNAK